MPTSPDRHCRVCAAPLVVGGNWNVSNAKTCNYICRTCLILRDASRYKANREKRCAQAIAWRQAQPPEKRRNRKKARAYSAAWSKANPEKVCANASRYRARKKMGEAPITQAQLQAVLEVYELALMCEGFTGQRFDVDHRTPLYLGGSSLAENLQVLPAAMNYQKHTKPHDAALLTVAGYADWVNGPPTYERATSGHP